MQDFSRRKSCPLRKELKHLIAGDGTFRNPVTESRRPRNLAARITVSVRIQRPKTQRRSPAGGWVNNEAPPRCQRSHLLPRLRFCLTPSIVFWEVPVRLRVIPPFPTRSSEAALERGCRLLSPTVEIRTSTQSSFKRKCVRSRRPSGRRRSDATRP